MPQAPSLNPLTGHAEFDRLIAAYASIRDPAEKADARAGIRERFGAEGAVFISDMAGFSSMSRKFGVVHFLKLIHRARKVIGPAIADNGGVLVKSDADNCYAFFEEAGDAIRASFDVNAALCRLNDSADPNEQICLSVGIDYGEILLVGDRDFFGDPVNTASKLGEELATGAETLVTERALREAKFAVPESTERMMARISGIEIRYVRVPMTKALAAAAG